VELHGDLIRLYERKDMGDNVDLVIRNKEDRKNKYAAALEELTSRIEKEKGLNMSMPRFTGIVRVTPADMPQGDMRESAEIELRCWEVAMRNTPQVTGNISGRTKHVEATGRNHSSSHAA